VQRQQQNIFVSGSIDGEEEIVDEEDDRMTV
jgi:hypothetical protein